MMDGGMRNEGERGVQDDCQVSSLVTILIVYKCLHKSFKRLRKTKPLQLIGSITCDLSRFTQPASGEGGPQAAGSHLAELLPYLPLQPLICHQHLFSFMAQNGTGYLQIVHSCVSFMPLWQNNNTHTRRFLVNIFF